MRTLKVGLTPEQIAKRKSSIGGSDANTICSGNLEWIHNLYREKRGEKEPDDLSEKLNVQMGIYTEELNRVWYERATGNEISGEGSEVKAGFQSCTLDGLTTVDGRRAVFEAKHTAGWTREDEVVQRYMPQLHHNMKIVGVDLAVLSVLFGNHKHVHFLVEYDAEYGRSLYDLEVKFWDWVQGGQEPTEFAAPVVPDQPTEFITIDMTGSNAWGHHAPLWADNKYAAGLFDKAAKELKALVKPNVKRARGHGVEINRARNGSLRIKETNDE